jgi:hypothetical protein
MRASSIRGGRNLNRAWILAALLGILAFAGSAPAQDPSAADADPPLLPAPPGLTADDVFAKVIEHNQLRNSLLREYSEVRTYEIRTTSGRLSAQAVVQITYRAPDEKNFQAVSQQGSLLVRHLVFDRLISAEQETAAGREHHDSAITAANYTFTLLGMQDLGPYHCFVVEAEPRTQSKYLFEGRIWIDAQDFAIVRIAGHPARKLSFWIHRIEFVRQYQRIGENWLPYEDDSCVDVRAYGRRVFTIDHRQYSVNGAVQLPAAEPVPASAPGFCRGEKREAGVAADEMDAGDRK